MASDDERPKSENEKQQSSGPPAGGYKAAANFLLENRMETALYISRAFSLYFALHYFLPIFA